MDSILQSIKALLGVNPEMQYADNELIMHINAALMVLDQLGVGKANFQITGPMEIWSDYLDTDDPLYGAVRSYVFMKVKLIWDPPTSSTVLESYSRSIEEFEWRLNDRAENPVYKEETADE